MIDYSKIDIRYADGRYYINSDKLELGYLFVKDIDTDLGIPIWEGSTPLLKYYASGFGSYIVQSDFDR